MTKPKGSRGAELGRPRWEPPDLDTVRKLAMRGLTQEQIAAALGISEATLYERKHDYPGFAEAIKRGRAEGIARMAETVMKKGVQEENLIAAMFFLKCHAGWREGVDVGLDARSFARQIKQALAEMDQLTIGAEEEPA